MNGGVDSMSTGIFTATEILEKIGIFEKVLDISSQKNYCMKNTIHVIAVEKLYLL